MLRHSRRQEVQNGPSQNGRRRSQSGRPVEKKYREAWPFKSGKVLNRDIKDAHSFLSLEDWELILCNPPYVSARDMEQLPPEYLHEPELALAAGLDGLDLFDSIFEISSHLMSPSGILIGEVGGSQAAFCEKYKTVDLSWPDLYDGGEGVFLLERNALDSHT